MNQQARPSGPAPTNPGMTPRGQRTPGPSFARSEGNHGGTAASIPFAAHAVRLSPRQWLLAAALVAAAAAGIPRCWERLEPLPEPVNNRLPYRLGNDYWTFARYARQAADPSQTLLIGDSVVWGHYVGKDSTLSAHLNRLRGSGRYVNLGVDGIHPAAMAGLLRCYGRSLAGRRVILHCNLLWMSSPRHDLTDDKEFAFNHPSLVPQFWPAISCYKESLSGRLGHVVGRNVGFLGWAKHLQIAYFDSRDLTSWMLEHPYDNPLRRLTLALPSPDDPPSPPPSQESWEAQRIPKANFRWVELSESLQWRSFGEVLGLLQRRGNQVFVLVGPFNEHMLLERSLKAYAARKAFVRQWLAEAGIPHHVAEALPSETYADASHPLDRGYALLAGRLLADAAFQRFDP